MASAAGLVDGLSCGLCHEIYRDPLELPCGHFYCRSCVDDLQQQQETPSCPQCRAEFSPAAVRSNPVLNALLAHWRAVPRPPSPPDRPLCPAHGRALDRYCLGDAELLCVDCRDSRPHLYHEVLNARDAVQEFKEKFENSAAKLKGRMERLSSQKDGYTALLQGIEDQTRSAEERIRESFGKLRSFMEEEERAALQRLWEQEGVARVAVMEAVQAADEGLQLLAGSLDALQLQLKEEDNVAFLKNIEDTRQKADVILGAIPEPSVTSEQLLWAGPLQFWVWKKMRSVLDLAPISFKLNKETACPFLKLDSNTRVHCGDKRRDVPDLPQRFDPAACVLGEPGFSEGVHYWEVEVGEKKEWGLGVARDSVKRKGEMRLCPAQGFWVLVRQEDQYGAYTSPPTPLSVSPRPTRIGICLDYAAGKLSFFNPDRPAHIYSFQASFAGPLHPFFFVGVSISKDIPLSIVPAQV
ncbi:nuclear factor 7, ovary [Amia ocellicauda]|uniref:nuclear factor 7, ovary n=1 Tax=Amia ocellicauda TaxID=2972642 RepID=UPI0034638E26